MLNGLNGLAAAITRKQQLARPMVALSRSRELRQPLHFPTGQKWSSGWKQKGSRLNVFLKINFTRQAASVQYTHRQRKQPNKGVTEMATLPLKTFARKASKQYFSPNTSPWSQRDIDSIILDIALIDGVDETEAKRRWELALEQRRNRHFGQKARHIEERYQAEKKVRLHAELLGRSPAGLTWICLIPTTDTLKTFQARLEKRYLGV